MQYQPELDGLRAIAVVAVVLFHSEPYGIVSGGFLGVDLFFVLSGYLITSILVREHSQTGTIDLKHFYWRRAWRLMPALLLFLAAYLAVAPFVWPHHPHARDALLTALYLSDYSYAFWELPAYLQHTWSLAVEEHFYILWPLLLVPLLRNRSPIVWLAAAWVVVTLWRTSMVGDWTDYYYRFDTRASGLIVGAMLALRPVAVPIWLPWTGVAAFCGLLFTTDIRLSALAIPFAEAAAAALVLGARRMKLLAAPVFVWPGKLSYAMYLWHFPIAHELRDRLDFVPTALLTLALSALAAWVSFLTAEAWGRRMKTRSNLYLQPDRVEAGAGSR